MVALAYLIIISFALGYIFLILYIIDGWDKIDISSLNENNLQTSGLSVLIAARNEEDNISKCIHSILANDTDSPFEIIIINDHSSDQTLHIINGIGDEKVTVLDLPDRLTGKKSALAYGVAHANYALILCTDADSVVGPHWIQSHQYFQANYNVNIQTSLVIPKDEGSVLSRFQVLDFIATMAITANGIKRKTYHLANGANLCYKKSFFNDVKGFDGNQNIASGDDVFLMEKAAITDVDKIGFLKSLDAIVITKSESTWISLFNQRKRWASKSMKISDKNVVKIQSYVFSFCLTIILSIILGSLFIPEVLFAGLTALGIKMVVDYMFLSKLTSYFKQEQVMKSFFLVFFIYFIHILYSGVIAVLPSPYVWKDRSNR